MYSFLLRILICLSFILFFNILHAQNGSSYSLAQLDSSYRALYSQKQHPEALQCALDLVAKGQQELDTRDTAYAKFLFYAGESYRANRDFNNAIPYLQKALVIQQNKAPRSAALGNSLQALAVCYFYLNRYPESEKYFRQALATRREALGNQHPDYIQTLTNLGILLASTSNFFQAENVLLEASEANKMRAGEQSVEYARSLNNLASLYMEMSEIDKAESYALQALETLRAALGEDLSHPSYAGTLNNLGNIYSELAESGRAEDFYRQTLQIHKQSVGERHPSYATALNNLGVLYLDRGDFDQSERYLLQVRDLQKEILGEDDPNYSHTLNNLGALYRGKGDLAQSERYLLEALAIQKKIHGEQHPDYALGLSNLAELYQGMGNIAKAEKLYLQALAIQKNAVGSRHISYINYQHRLAGLYAQHQQWNKSWVHIREAIAANTDLWLGQRIHKGWIDSLSESTPISTPKLIESLENLYNLLPNIASVDASAQQQLLCQFTLQRLERSKNEVSSEEDKLYNLEKSSTWVLKSIQSMNIEQDAEQAFRIAEQNKSVLLLDAASNKRAHAFGILPDSLVQLEKKLQKQFDNTKAALAEKRSTSELDSLHTNLTDLSLRLNAFQKEIQTNYPKYAALRYQRESVQASEIQARLDEQTALLEYLISDSLVYLFYLDKKSIRLQALPIPAPLLKSRIQTLHRALSDHEQIVQNPDKAYTDYTESAHWFYQQLVAPAGISTANIRRLLIVSDGELGYVPFETFLVEPATNAAAGYRDLHYLINDFTISYHYSATLWKENESANKRPNNRQLLGIAADYTRQIDSTRTQFRLPADLRLRARLSPLPSAREEVSVLSKHFKGFFAFDQSASEALFKQKAADFAVIHLALHGLLNQREPLLSSLAFTEDGDSVENNFLQAYEISKMELNADLIVLSACETGYGKFEKGNGIASLARAFMYAGAPALAVSLWEVNDNATSQLMEYFYNNLADGMPKDEALRQAKLSYLKEANGQAAHPAYWSPFIQMGNTQPMELQRKSDWSLIAWLVGGGLLILGGLWWRGRARG